MLDFQAIQKELLEILYPLGADTDPRFLAFASRGFAGDELAFVDHVRRHAPGWFMTMRERPDWLQEPAWPLRDGAPMVFVGQLERLPAETGLHDSARYFVFWDPASGVTDTILQVE